MHRPVLYRRCVVAVGLTLLCASGALAEQKSSELEAAKSSPSTAKPAPKQAELEAAFTKMLSGATLEGSFTNTGQEADSTNLSREKYSLGAVKKLQGDYWLIPARIEYGEKDVTIPLTLPVKWAGDTPMIVVDDVGLPGFGTVSARVMFFADHYAGYWRHGEHGGHLFGVISHDAKALNNSADEPSPSGDTADGKQVK